MPYGCNGELSNQSKLQTPIVFSFKKGTTFGSSDKEPATLLFALINSLKEQID
jgi:hypothetical protein